MKFKRKKRVRSRYKYLRKSNFDFLSKILRILSWLLPGLVIKRWMITYFIRLGTLDKFKTSLLAY